MALIKPHALTLRALATTTIAAICAAAAGAVKTATPFADNMVLQRGMAVPVWGTAEAGERVTVSFAGQTKSTTADAVGKWFVTLDPMPESAESRTLTVAGAANSEECRNVLVGEVWFASGQSNMNFPIWGGNVRARDKDGKYMMSVTRRPLVRFVKNPQVASPDAPRLDWKAVWYDYSPESFKKSGYKLGAVAFYYALELYNALGIPVGIVDSSWGGTYLSPWTPPSGFAGRSPVHHGDKPVVRASSLWNGMVAAWTPMAMRGFIWYQGESEGMTGTDGRYCEEMHGLYNGWAKEFGNPGLKLYFAQLAPWKRSWFKTHLEQARFAAEEKNAAMSVLCDVGNPYDIHPNNKQIVARRLALHALRRDYGFTDIIDDSPTLKSCKVDGGKFILSFDNAKSWYYYNADRSEPKGFEIAGPDGKFMPAMVVNKDAKGNITGSELVVKADGVAEPRKLRYLAASPWIGSIYSFDSGLPLGPFETRDPTERHIE